jgi:hypothetical protein
MTTSPISYSDIAAHRKWREHRSGLAYLRGVPTWVWRQSLRHARATTVT